jgi:hypothetical protein
VAHATGIGFVDPPGLKNANSESIGEGLASIVAALR